MEFPLASTPTIPPESPAEDQVNTAFMREVDDELRRSEALAFWQRWGKWLIAAVLLGLAAFGGWLYWQNLKTDAAGVEAEKLAAVIDDLQANRTATAGTALAPLAKSEVPGNRAVAQILAADLKLQANDVKAAVAGYRAVAADTKLSAPFRDLATIRAVAAEFDSMDPNMVVETLKPLAKPGNPWFGSAGEMTAMAYLKLNRPRDAAPLFAALAKDEGVPETLRSRAVQMAGILGVDAVAERDLVGAK